MRKGDTITTPRSKEHRSKLSIAMIGNTNQEKKRSVETRIKISEAMKGNTNTLGHCHNATMKLRCRLAKLADKNPAWLGGQSFFPYTAEWTNELKESIRIRDNYTCQLCGFHSNNKRLLHIHHIDYDKRNNSNDNLITLCNSCHSKTNHHRPEWGILDGRFCRDEANVRDRYEGSPRNIC